MDELLWCREFEDVHDWVERLEMAAEMKVIDELKLFKVGIYPLLRGKSKEWFKKLIIVSTNWQTMKTFRCC